MPAVGLFLGLAFATKWVGLYAIGAIAVLVLGGLLTPVMLRTGRDPRDALFAYLLLLDLGTRTTRAVTISVPGARRTQCSVQSMPGGGAPM